MFITFEGIDGCGKSTQLDMLAEVLETRGYEVLKVREPGATPLSEAIREILLSVKHTITPVAEMMLFAASRAQLVETVIRPALQSGKIILCDRFIDSTTAYQGYGRGISLDNIKKCNEIATNGLLPVRTYFLDISPECAKTRFQGQSLDRMERAGEEFFKRVRDGYNVIAVEQPERIVKLDAERSIGELHEGILRDMMRCFEQNKAAEIMVKA
ncbi:MAG TPA: dTMP kinase [Patescibacteria group bacterium]|nr:dTMP kinase [Patescibacteria group bacterium]